MHVMDVGADFGLCSKCNCKNVCKHGLALFELYLGFVGNIKDIDCGTKIDAIAPKVTSCFFYRSEGGKS